MKTNIKITSIFTFALLTLISVNLLVGSPVTTDISKPNRSINTQGLGPAQADWYEGTDQTTAEVDVTYLEEYEQSTGPTHPDNLKQIMWLEYNDGTNTKLGFEIYCAFEAGGLDFTNNTVLDWNKLERVEPTLVGQSYYNESVKISSRTLFNGLNIVSGTAQEFQWENETAEDGWGYGPSTAIWAGAIEYRNSTTKIGPVTLSTSDYLYNNQTLKKSIATFNVTINATIGDDDRLDIPVVLMFQITHNITATSYKYGVVIDWSAHKDFQTGVVNQLNTGDDFSLVASDALQLYITVLDDATYPLNQFETNAENDTAIFTLGAAEYGRLDYTTTYDILGTGGPYNTTRIFFDVGAQFGSKSSSLMLVIFDGFKYNQSTGLTFDPYVLVPSSKVDGGSGIPWGGMLMNLIGLLAVISFVFHFKRNKNI